MADKNENIKIGIEVFSDKKKTEEVIKEIEKDVIKTSTKIKPIKLSVKASTQFEANDPENKKEANRIKKLNEAQSKLIAHWNRQFEKGFKSSPEFERITQELFKKYNAAAKGKHGSFQSEEIKSVIGKHIKDFNAEVNEQFVKKFGITLKDINGALNQWRKDVQANLKLKGEKRANEIADKNFLKNLKKGAGRGKASTPGGPTNLGTRTSNLDDTYYGMRNKKGEATLLRTNDRLGTYYGRNSLLKQYAEGKLKYKKRDKDSLKISKINGFDAQYLTNLFNKGDKKRIFDYQKSAGSNKNYNDIAKEAGSLMGAAPDITTDALIETITKAMTETISKTNFKDILTPLRNSMVGVKNELLKRFEDGGVLGVNYGEEGEYKGVNINYERWKEGIQEIFKGFESFDIKKLQEVFDSVRGPLTDNLNNIINQEKAVADEIYAYKKQIQQNEQKLITEFKSRDLLENSLKEYRHVYEKSQNTLKSLEAEQQKIKNAYEKSKEAFAKIEAEYKDDYFKAREEYDKITEEYKKISNNDSLSQAQKQEEYEKVNAARKKLSANPYLEEKNKHSDIGDKLLEINKAVQKEKTTLDATEKKVKKYEQELISLNSLTEDEIKQRKEQEHELVQTNAQLQQTIDNLEKFKDGLKEKEQNAHEKLYDPKSYEGLQEVLKSSLSPLVDKSFGDLADATKETAKSIEHQTDLDKLENDRQGVLQDEQINQTKDNVSATEKQTDAIIDDANTGLDTDAAKDKLLEKVTGTNRILGNDVNDVLSSINTTLSLILDQLKTGGGRGSGNNKNHKKDAKDEQSLLPTTKIWQHWFSGGGEFVDSQVQDRAVEDFRPTVRLDTTDWDKKYLEAEKQKDEKNRNEAIMKNIINKMFPPEIMNTFTKPFESFLDKLKNILNGSISEADKVLRMSQEEQQKIQAELIATYGVMDTSRNATAVGDKIRANRIKDIFNWGGKKRQNPFENLKLTTGMGTIDTTAITDAMQKSIQKNMFKAQTGGWFKNLIGPPTLYLGQESLEKSRAQIDGFNTMMEKMRDATNSLVQAIQTREENLEGMRKSGRAVFNADGTLDLSNSVPEAKTLLQELESMKLSLAGVLVDAKAVNEIVDKSDGKVSTILKRVKFFSPILRENNMIASNLNAGLTKTGKALKFQTRTAELLNYTFQLMGRSVGQMLKNWIQQLNPITQIKKAFSNFASWNTKWQRTMNVIKYNVHAILEPFMDKVAQFLVNALGFVDIISMKVQEAFGHMPISLFDQAAADSQKIREELEAGANASAGFDELHDIGSDNSGANDLLGDIYTPQLPEAWEKLANKIGDIFANIIPTIKNIGDFITTHWTKLLNTLLGIFLAWPLLKIAGKLLADALFDGLTDSNMLGVLSKIGGIALIIVGITKAVKGLIDYLNDPTWENFGNIIQGVGIALGGLGLFIGNIPLIVIGAGVLILGTIVKYWDKISAFLWKGLQWLVEQGDWVRQHLGDVIGDLYDGFVNSVINIVYWFDTIFTSIKGILDGIIKFVKGVFTGDWKLAWEGVKDIFANIWKAIYTTVSAICYAIFTIISTIGNVIKDVLLWPFKKISEIISDLSDSENRRGGGGGRHRISSYAVGTNYVPNDGLAYLHQGEAVIPKKYNQPYQQGMSNEERAYLQQMMATMKSLDGTMKQGITVNGQFVQRGSDLVAVVNKTKSQTGADLLSNVSYAR